MLDHARCQLSSAVGELLLRGELTLATAECLTGKLL
jgi:nicotinamide mononucleotide (NMN) deamidase PncC